MSTVTLTDEGYGLATNQQLDNNSNKAQMKFEARESDKDNISLIKKEEDPQI